MRGAAVWPPTLGGRALAPTTSDSSASAWPCEYSCVAHHLRSGVHAAWCDGRGRSSARLSSGQLAIVTKRSDGEVVLVVVLLLLLVVVVVVVV